MDIRTALPIAIFLAAGTTAEASELSYTFIDFRVLSNSVDAAGLLAPIPNQEVGVDAADGDGISVAGAVALPAGFYVTGAFNSSIVDVDALIRSPLAEARVNDEFDVITSSFGVGYRRELRPNFDVIVELTYDTAEFDFGSLAGEDFDTEGSGAAGRVGFRWNPTEPFEVYAAAGYSPVGEVSLSDRRFDSAAIANAGVRWYFFEDLGVGLDYQSGDISVLTMSMRFSFGELPW